jgi:hypothetical protein
MSAEREALIDFANALEAACVSLRMGLGEQPQRETHTWNPEKIAWVKTEGTHGTYEKTEDYNNLDYKAMLKDLAAHNGKLQRNGLFYWTFQNGTTVGRKPARKHA